MTTADTLAPSLAPSGWTLARDVGWSDAVFGEALVALPADLLEAVHAELERGAQALLAAGGDPGQALSMRETALAIWYDGLDDDLAEGDADALAARSAGGRYGH
ncbi:MAG: hypothetical protein KDH92_00525 [Chloroflexi bacterium]|nr:hypothetical protein [Chloroflexota bacterium]